MISKERMADIVSYIIEYSEEIKAKETIDEMDFGQLLAYAEALSMIQDTVENSLKSKKKDGKGGSAKKISKKCVSDIVSNIIERAVKIKAKETIDAQDFGQLLAYAEALCIIRDCVDEDDLGKIGLDFDIDKRFLL